ncbi:MAG: phosphotransferase [Clostridia bacterium]|nr:phosphotransferase [Clostridia bacterium]
MFNITLKDIDRILRDFGIETNAESFTELQRYNYDSDEPDSKLVRLIVKVETQTGEAFVIRLKNEKEVTEEILEQQCAFQTLMLQNGIITPRAHTACGHFVRNYCLNDYNVLVCVEEFVQGQLRLVDEAAAEKTGELLARMHNIAEAVNAHIANKVLFDPLQKNDLFDFGVFDSNKEYLMQVDKALYEAIVSKTKAHFDYLEAFAPAARYAVQGDISDCNLYLNESGDIGVFDFNCSGDNVLFFDAAMQAIFEARLMVDYPEDIASDPESVILPAFLRGYDRIRPFTAEERAAYPHLYALCTAFWLMRLRWDDDAIINAIKEDDRQKVRECMRVILNDLTENKEFPI